MGDTAGTGFGTVTRDLGVALVGMGHDLRIISMNEDAAIRLDKAWPEVLRDRVVLLGDEDGWLALGAFTDAGQEARVKLVMAARGVFTGHTVKGWIPEAALFIGDLASLKQSPWPAWLPPDLPAFNYVPIEGIDIPPRWRHIWDRIRPIAMCEFGADQIEQIMGERPPVAYHGVDPESFWPVSGKRPLVMQGRKGLQVLRSRAECRAFLGWPKNATILFRADRHVPRKNYASLFRSIAPVLARHEDVGLIWHCKTIDQGGDLNDEGSKYPDPIAARMASTTFHDRLGGVDRKVLCAMYNAADIYVSTSAEGFGLTIAESLACGTPAIGLNYSSVPEVIGDAGLLVGYRLQDNPYSYFWAMPIEQEFAEAVERLVVDKGLRQDLGRKGPEQIARFTWNKAAEVISSSMEAPVRRKILPPAQRLAALGLIEARA